MDHKEETSIIPQAYPLFVVWQDEEGGELNGPRFVIAWVAVVTDYGPPCATPIIAHSGGGPSGMSEYKCFTSEKEGIAFIERVMKRRKLEEETVANEETP